MTESSVSPQLPLALALEDYAVFETFHAPGGDALLAAARHPEPPGLWVAGPADSGKSHLLQAVCAQQAGRRVGYVSLAAAPAPAMLEGLEDLDLVCLDDLEAAAGDPSWERALFGLVNGLLLNQGCLVAGAAGAPREIGISLPDLVSRFEALTRFRLRRLDDEELIRALQKRAEFRGLELPSETARYLLRRMPRDMRRLTALLDELDSASMAAARRLTVPFVREVLGR